MRSFWTRRPSGDALEGMLRAEREEPRPEFVRELAARIERRRSIGRGRLRIALTAGLTGGLLVALSASGALGYAASGVDDAVIAVKRVSASSVPLQPLGNAGSDQYKPGKGCGDKNHAHERRHQCKAKVNDVRAREGNSGLTAFTFTISLDNTPIDTVTIGYVTSDGSAVAGSDYIPTSGTATFAPGVTAQTVTVYVIGDTVKEQTETFALNLVEASANALIADAVGVGTIVNDD